MLWSNGGGKPPGLKPAAFADVTKGSRRPPAWVGGNPKKPPQEAPDPAPEKPPQAAERAERAAPGAQVVPRAPRVPSEALQERASLRPNHPPVSTPRTSLIAMEMVSPLESLRVPGPAVAPPPEPSLEMIEGFASALESLADARRRLMDDSAEELAKLAGLIAKRVIGREVSLDPRIVLALVQEGLEALGQHDRIQVRLGPEFESVQSELAQRLKSRGVEFDVFVDVELPPYGCLVETDLGRVDESVERRLEQLLRGLIVDSETPPTT